MKSRPVFVFDTNAFVSIALFPASPVRSALKKAETIGSIVLSADTLTELADVLLRSKFDKYLSVEDRLEFITRIETRFEIVRVQTSIKACRDPKDDMFLELAIAANASCIITGDKALLELHPFQGIPIVNAADFMSMTF